MAEKRSSKPAEATAAETIPADSDAGRAAEWLAQAAQQGLSPEQLLACLALGWMGRQRDGGEAPAWIWNEEPQGSTDLSALRQRLEVIQLAVQTGAPLSTAEVTQLMGARPGADLVERGGLRARRVSRNVWKLGRSGDARESFGGGSVVPFSESFRPGLRSIRSPRRLACLEAGPQGNPAAGLDWTDNCLVAQPLRSLASVPLTGSSAPFRGAA